MTADLLEVKTDVNGTTFQAAANAAGYGGSSHKVPPPLPQMYTPRQVIHCLQLTRADVSLAYRRDVALNLHGLRGDMI